MLEFNSYSNDILDTKYEQLNKDTENLNLLDSSVDN